MACLSTLVTLFSQPAPASPTNPTGSSTAPTLGRADEAFRANRMDEARALYDSILANAFLSPRDRALALCRKGLIASLGGGFNEAMPLLEASLKGGVLTPDVQASCAYALLQIYVMKNRSTDALQVLETMGDPKLAPDYQARTWALGAESARQAGNSEREIIYLKRLLLVMESHGLKTVPLRILGRRVVSLGEVKKRLGMTPSEPESGPGSATSALSASADRLQKLMLFLNGALDDTTKGRWAEATTKWQAIDERKLVDPLMQMLGWTPPLSAMRERLVRMASEDRRALRIGVLVPSDRDLASVSHRILRATSAFLASPGVKGANVSVFVRAVPADPGAVEQAALELALDEGVAVIVGPVSSTLALGAVSVSETFGVPLFALGPVAEPIALRHPLVVRMGVLAESQSRALVEEARASELRNVAILAPNDAYGVEMAQNFSKFAEASSLPIERTTFYDASSDIFRDGVKEALGSQDNASRPESDTLVLEEARKKAAAEKRKFNPADVKLPAIVRFDGVFVPDSLHRGRIIASTFAYFEARGLRFLGDRQWIPTDRKRSLADDLVAGARVPVLLSGRYSAHLFSNLGLPPLTEPMADLPATLDLERQVFDALLLSRQGQFLANGINGWSMVRGLKSESWRLEGTTRLAGVSESGEPMSAFGLKAFRKGTLTPDLPSWKGETWQDDLTQWNQKVDSTLPKPPANPKPSNAPRTRKPLAPSAPKQ
jgi:ABC-type branched-subunit amino acid transport system substrate-binding protein